MCAVALSAVLAAVAPTPYDLFRADVLLHLPPGAGGGDEYTPRLRAALLTRMLQSGAIDPGDERHWFDRPADFGWHLDEARLNVRLVRDCPTLADGDWLPDGWTCARVTDGLLAQARGLRERARWEPDRAAEYERAAAACDDLYGRWLLIWHADPGHQRPLTAPRRVALKAVRDALGPLWDARRPPDQAVWHVLTAR